MRGGWVSLSRPCRRRRPGKASERVPGVSLQVVGTVLPFGQGKPLLTPEWSLPKCSPPLDVETATLGTQAGRRGMLGCGRDPARWLSARARRSPRKRRIRNGGSTSCRWRPCSSRWRGSPASWVQSTGRAASRPRRGRLTGTDGCSRRSRLASRTGRLRLLRDVEELSVFGVKSADLSRRSGPTIEYVPRDEDGSARSEDLLLEAIAGRRVLLVVGASAAGKSRSLARARTGALGPRLPPPRARMLADLVELSVVRLGRAVVWLDDVALYAHAGLRDTLERLLDAGLAVVGTVRRAELERLAPPGDVRNPAGEALHGSKHACQPPRLATWMERGGARAPARAGHASAAAGGSRDLGSLPVPTSSPAPGSCSVSGTPEPTRSALTAPTHSSAPSSTGIARASEDGSRSARRQD